MILLFVYGKSVPEIIEIGRGQILPFLPQFKIAYQLSS
jgi:hypothetical protein